MSKNITLFGQDLSNVPALNVPLQGGGTARFIDEDDAGGGGEITTCNVTINNDGKGMVIYPSWNQANDAIATAINYYETETVTVCLYDGKAIAFVQATNPPSQFTGNVTNIDGFNVLITGDGSFKVN